MDSDEVTRLVTQQPSTVYRQYLYRPDSDIARWIDENFHLVARPGSAPIVTPREGDLIVQVPLGKGGVGQCAALDAMALSSLGRRGHARHGELLLRLREPIADTEAEVGEADKNDADEVMPPAAAALSPAQYWQQALRFGLAGNTVQPLIDGPDTFAAIQRAIESATTAEHYIYLLGWWCDPWVHLTGAGSSLLDLLQRAGNHGVQTRILLWAPSRLFPTHVAVNMEAVAALNRLPNCHAQLDEGGGALSAKSHHQKLLVVRGREGLVALGGGVDVNADRLHTLPPPPGTYRSDRPSSLGWSSSSGSGSGGGGSGGASGDPLHDVHARVTGPGALPLLRIFLRRWWARSGSRAIDRTGPLRGTYWEPVPAPTGQQYVRVGETFSGDLRLPTRTVASRKVDTQDIWLRSLLAARRFIYIEDQYLTNLCAAEAIRRMLPRLDHVTILVAPSALADMPGIWRRRKDFLSLISRSPHRSKLHVYTPVSGPPAQCRRWGVHTYIHAKMAVIDDELALIGSANVNNRGWESDSELVIASFEDTPPSGLPVAHQLRRRLWSHHLDVPEADVTNASASRPLWDMAPSRRMCLYDPNQATDTIDLPDGVADPHDRQATDPCCVLLGRGCP